MRTKYPYPLFLSVTHRDQYLDAAIGRGKQVRATVVYVENQRVFIADLRVACGAGGHKYGQCFPDFGMGGYKRFTGELFTVETIDGRKGK